MTTIKIKFTFSRGFGHTNNTTECLTDQHHEIILKQNEEARGMNILVVLKVTTSMHLSIVLV